MEGADETIELWRRPSLYFYCFLNALGDIYFKVKPHIRIFRYFLSFILCSTKQNFDRKTFSVTGDRTRGCTNDKCVCRGRIDRLTIRPFVI